MQNLNKHDIEFLLDCLKNGKEIPEVYKYAIFPTKQKEYELVYAGKMRKEDVLADTEEAKPVPLQVEKVFNGNKYPLFSKNWHNLLVFGDNLQILKTFDENKDPLIRNKVRGRVKFIYIDPPFGTGDEYDGAKGQVAYSAKKKGADFVEYLRRRLILLREILSDDGTICIRLDYHFGHYLKVILDEVFGKENFINELVVNRVNKKGFASRSAFRPRKYPIALDSLFIYSKSTEYYFSPVKLSNTNTGKEKWHSMEAMDATPNIPKPRIILGKKMLAPYGSKWKFSQENIYEMERLGLIRLNNNGRPMYKVKNQDFSLLDTNWSDIPGYSFSTGYPTENSEQVLDRVINTLSEPGDIILDVFAGSGTTAAVAEKLNRRWIACDIGKLAIYTIQKRLLEIDKSKELKNRKDKYGKLAKSFIVVTSGLYDLGKVFALQKDEYIHFVKNLFEIEETKTTKIGGVEIDGKKREFYTKIFPYWELKNVSVDEKYLQELHKNIGKKIDGRFYIVAPANNVDFISDYHEIGDIRYYFLKVPYQIIKELHKVQFKKFRQPQSKSQINDLDEAIGFHFIRQPEVKSVVKTLKDKVVLKIKKFESAYSQDDTGEKLKNFESLAMLLVDLNYDGEKFMMTDYFFAQDLLNQKKKEDDESEEEIKKKLTKQKEIKKEFPKKDCGKQIMAIYVDIYGNEFREKFNVK